MVDLVCVPMLNEETPQILIEEQHTRIREEARNEERDEAERGRRRRLAIKALRNEEVFSCTIILNRGP